MEEAELLVVCDAPFGPGNVENLRLALAAASGGVPTVVLEQVPIAERDFTAGPRPSCGRRSAGSRRS